MAEPPSQSPTTVDLESLNTDIQGCQKVIGELFRRNEVCQPLFQSGLALYTICGTLTLQLDQVHRTVVSHSLPDPGWRASLPDDFGRNFSVIKRQIFDFHRNLKAIDEELHWLTEDSVPFPLPIRTKNDIKKMTKQLEGDHKTFSKLWDACYHKDSLKDLPEHMLDRSQSQFEEDQFSPKDRECLGRNAKFQRMRVTEFDFCRQKGNWDRYGTIIQQRGTCNAEKVLPALKTLRLKLNLQDHVLTSTKLPDKNIFHEVYYPYPTLKECFEHPPDGHDLWPSLADRIRVAFQIVQAVHAMHSVHLIHGTITPGFIFMPRSYLNDPNKLESSDQEPAVGTPLLAGFHRMETFEIKGVKAKILKDFRSLGITLLAVALWKDPFSKKKDDDTDQLDQSWDTCYDEELIDVAWRVGNKYAEVVKYCLEVAKQSPRSLDLDRIRMGFRENVYEVFENILA